MKRSGSATTRTSTNGQSSRSGYHASSRGYNYIEGSAAHKLQTEPAKKQKKVQRRPAKRQKVKAAPMNMGYIAVMVIALVIVCCVLIGYIRIQSDITNHVTNISKLESQLNEMRLANDETYTKIMSSIDLEEIKRIAVSELGMKYAKEGQVIQYTGEGNDYVRQYSDIPD